MTDAGDRSSIKRVLVSVGDQGIDRGFVERFSTDESTVASDMAA